MTFNNIIENIKACNGKIINLIYDNRSICDEFLMCITNELENYNIIDPIDQTNSRFSIENLKSLKSEIVKGKNIIFLNGIVNNDNTDYGVYLNLINCDTTLVILRNYFSTNNTQLKPYVKEFDSSLDILLRNEKILILKSLYDFRDDPNYPKSRILDIKRLIRKSKLKTLNKK